MIKREPPKMWRGRIVKEKRWVFRVPTLRFRDAFYYVVGSAILFSIAYRVFLGATGAGQLASVRPASGAQSRAHFEGPPPQANGTVARVPFACRG